MSVKRLRLQADRLFPDTAENYTLKKLFFAVLKSTEQDDWLDSCQSVTALFYILLREQGLPVRACLGLVEQKGLSVGHTWIELDGLVYDLPIKAESTDDEQGPVVFAGTDLLSGQPSERRYIAIDDQTSGHSLGHELEFISINTLSFCMDAGSDHERGLWGVAGIIAKGVGIKFNRQKARQKYAADTWNDPLVL